MDRGASDVEILVNGVQAFVEGHPFKNHLYFFVHHHRLTSSSDDDLHERRKTGQFHCSECRRRIEVEDPSYGCDKCKFYIHKACAELPQLINHPFDPYHTLTLLPETKSLSQGGEKLCSACQFPLRGTTYGCSKCQITVHKFCLELPSEIPHPRDPAYRRALDERASRSHRVVSDSSFYPFANYKFRRNISSFFRGAPSNFTGRVHILTLALFQGHPNSGHELDCEDCITCGKKLRKGLPVFSCELCLFSFHFRCALPPIIKSKCHVHPLSLVETHVVEEDDSDDEFYCDACEEERNPKLPVYQCLECEYIAHFTCPFSQGDLSLAHSLGCDESDKLAIVITNPNLTMDGIFRFTTRDETAILTRALFDANYEVGTGNKLFRNEVEDSGKISRYSDNSFTEFVKRYESRSLEPYYEFHCEPTPEVVNVDGYIIPKNFALILKALLSKYGDFSPRFTMSPKGKMPFFILLCDAVYSMCCTKTADVTESQLFAWWDFLRIAEHAGFKIHFAFDRLKRAVHAYFGLHATVAPDFTLDELDKKIAQLGGMVESPVALFLGNKFTNLSFDGIISHSITDGEEKEIQIVWETARNRVGARRKLFSDKKDDSDSSRKVSLCSNKAFTQFMERYESSTLKPNHDYNYECPRVKVVNVGGYFIPMKFAPVLKALFAKYGDFSKGSMMSPRAKVVFFVTVCDSVCNMCSTKVIDITENKLFTWWDCLRIAEHAGFKIQFAFDRLKEAIHDHFADHHAITSPDLTLHELDREIKKLGAETGALADKLAPVVAIANSRGEGLSETLELDDILDVLDSWGKCSNKILDKAEWWEECTSETSAAQEQIEEECSSEKTSKLEKQTKVMSLSEFLS